VIAEQGEGAVGDLLDGEVEHGGRVGAVADQVAEAVGIIEASGLNGGNRNALEVKLRNVLRRLDKGHPTTAISIIENDFVPQVQSFIGSGKLTADEGSALLDLAAGLVANITQNS